MLSPGQADALSAESPMTIIPPNHPPPIHTSSHHLPPLHPWERKLAEYMLICVYSTRRFAFNNKLLSYDSFVIDCVRCFGMVCPCPEWTFVPPSHVIPRRTPPVHYR